MATSLRVKYDRLVQRAAEAKARTARAKAKYDQARTDEQAVEHELEATRNALDKALAGAEIAAEIDALLSDSKPKKATKAKPKPSGTPPLRVPPLRVPPFLLELCEAFPMGSTITVAELREALALRDSALNTRLQKAKKLGLIERVAQATYALTTAGTAAVGRRLQAVPD